MTIPDFETLVIERLVICLGEITGINAVFENPPTLDAGISSVPYAFPLVGAMVGSVPATTAGRVIVTRTYTVKVLGSSVDKDKDGAAGIGSTGYRALRLLIAPIRDYFMKNASLETNAGRNINKLRYIQQQIAYQEGGIDLDANEGRYVLRFNLTVTMGAESKRLA